MTTVVIEKTQICATCLAHAGALVGLEDGLPLRAQLDELTAELDRARAQVAEAETRAEQAEEALRQGAVFQRLIDSASGGSSRSRKPASKAA